jgi:lipid-A-disaccharide synthase
VPPQLWAWAGWRVKKMRRHVNHVLATLPFEPAWYAARGVRTEYVGHPYFDELPEQQLDEDFVARQKARPAPLVTLLPGSRRQEVRRNFPVLLRAAERVHAEQPGARFAVACYNEQQRDMVHALLAKSSLPAEVHVGKTPELIECAAACAAVSGSVGLELLWRLKPTTVVYRLNGRLDLFLGNLFRTCRFISLVNLLADEELFPEYLTYGDPSGEMASHLLRWLSNPAEHAAAVAKLRGLRAKVAEPGACERAARYVVDHLPGASEHPASAAA